MSRECRGSTSILLISALLYSVNHPATPGQVLASDHLQTLSSCARHTARQAGGESLCRRLQVPVWQVQRPRSMICGDLVREPHAKEIAQVGGWGGVFQNLFTSFLGCRYYAKHHFARCDDIRSSCEMRDAIVADANMHAPWLHSCRSANLDMKPEYEKARTILRKI